LRLRPAKLANALLPEFCMVLLGVSQSEQFFPADRISFPLRERFIGEVAGLFRLPILLQR
jgi:hypothetical protein